ncbi:uncharacterized protein LOC127774444 [Oryza glaberrima]|uniref:uncharacterized protein LOC127774444 n=1 Tax=Oryza glaberrima TaxID=4538 RepID=UPI00224C2A64|nr:uncharacterized protein LOC127774444 [Oryza glaberrima]
MALRTLGLLLTRRLSPRAQAQAEPWLGLSIQAAAGRRVFYSGALAGLVAVLHLNKNTEDSDSAAVPAAGLRLHCSVVVFPSVFRTTWRASVCRFFLVVGSASICRAEYDAVTTPSKQTGEFI